MRSQMIAFDRHLKGIEASLKPSEPSEQQPESKSRPWFLAAASATARTVLILFLQSRQQPPQPCFIWKHDPTTGLIVWQSLTAANDVCELRQKLRRSSAAVATSREGHRSLR